MYCNNFTSNNKVFRFSFIFFIALSIFFFLPNDTYAADIKNPKMEIYGYADPKPGVAQNPTDLLVGCTACESISNSFGTPVYVYVYLPKSTLSSYFEYTLTHSFNWKTNPSYSSWPDAPILQFSASSLASGQTIPYTQNTWTNTFNAIEGLYRARENWFSGTFVAPQVNLIKDEVVLVYRFHLENPDLAKTPYELIFTSWNIGLNTTGNNGDDPSSGVDITIDNAKNDIIINQNNIFNQTTEKFDEIIDEINREDADKNPFQNFLSNFEFKDNGGISSIVTLPIELIRSILNQDTCHDLSLEVLGANVSFPNGCYFWSRVPSERVTLYRMLICGLFSYICLTNLFHDIHYLKDPHNLGVDTLDL